MTSDLDERSVTRLADSVAGAWMVLRDPAARVNVATWRRQEALYRAAVDAALPREAQNDAELAAVARTLKADGDRREAHARVSAALQRHLVGPELGMLEDALAEVAVHGLTQLWLGGPDPARSSAVPTPDAPLEVAVVVPVRVREQARARNIEVALRVLRRSLRANDHVRVVVVEQDDRSRLPDVVRELADQTVLAYNPGPFNKGWAANLAVDLTDEATICVLDADYVLVRDALVWAVRDAQGAAVAFPHTDAVWLDAVSTARIARLSTQDGFTVAQVGPSTCTGYVLRDTLGLCVVVRREAFDAVDGFDERFEGWGDEDNDLVRRLADLGPVVRSAAVGMHLDHPRPVMVDASGHRPNKSIIGSPRPADRPRRGDPDRYRRSSRATSSGDGGGPTATSETEIRQS